MKFATFLRTPILNTSVNDYFWKQASLTGRPKTSGKPYFGPDLGLLGPNLGHKFFLRFQPNQMLDIIPSRNPVQYHGKLMTLTWENGEKHNLGPNLGP